MKAMKLVSVGLIVLTGVLYSSILSAQVSIPSAANLSDKLTEVMKAQLSLTADQLTKVKQFNLDYATKLISSGNDVTKVKTYDDELDANLKGVLDESQYSIWTANRKKWLEIVKKDAIQTVSITSLRADSDSTKCRIALIR